MATRKKRRTAAPPMAMPAMAPGERAGEEVAGAAEGEEEEVEVAVGEMVVNWNSVGVAEGEPEDDAPGTPEAERLT